MKLSQKERMLLEDQKSHEEMCIQKYQSYAQQASDSKLKQLFNTYATQEQQHLNTIQQILNGQIPNTTQQQTQQQSQSQPNSFTNTISSFMNSQSDAALCKDALMTEKYVSSAYNTTIFECMDANIRQTLNHIQKEEQQHGEGIFNYMLQNGMYEVQ